MIVSVNRATAIESLEVVVIVENTSDIFSTPGPSAESELSGHIKRGMRRFQGACICCAENGYSCLVTAVKDGVKRTVLFDTGITGDGFKGNARRLGVQFGEIDAIILSHGHYDHSGGLAVAVEAIIAENGGKRVPVYLHPGMFSRRALKLPSGDMLEIDDVPSPALLQNLGAEPILTTEPVSLFDGMFHISGEIERKTQFEVGLPGHLKRNDADTAWEPDPLIMDERFLVAHVEGKGLVIISGCSHGGIVNIVSQAQATHGDQAVHAILGGLHLAGMNEAIIPQTIAALKNTGVSILGVGHCTGWRAQIAFAEAFGTAAMSPSVVGKTYRF